MCSKMWYSKNFKLFLIREVVGIFYTIVSYVNGASQYQMLRGELRSTEEIYISTVTVAQPGRFSSTLLTIALSQIVFQFNRIIKTVRVGE